jgi:hypothetical protein
MTSDARLASYEPMEIALSMWRQNQLVAQDKKRRQLVAGSLENT